MPRYLYRCTACEESLTLSHLSNELVKDCPECASEGTLEKSLTRFSTPVKRSTTHQIGNITEEFIQDSREELLQQKKELEDSR